MGSLTRFQTGFLILFFLLLGMVFLQSQGTTDVDIWRSWTKNADTLGLVEGYAANQADYPPLASAFLLGGYRLFGKLGVDLFLSIKLTIFFFLLATITLISLWTRSLLVSLALYTSLLINTVGLGYIDIFFALTLGAALWMLYKNQLVWFSIFFTLSCLTKWQPLIIAPFIVLYLLQINDVRDWKKIAWKNLAGKVVLPAALVSLVVIFIYHPEPVWLSLKASLSHTYLSGNALNLGWVMTHFLHVFRPDEYGPLSNHLSTYIMTDDPRITFIPKLLFVIAYLAILVRFAAQPKTFEKLLVYSVAGFLAYFTLNTGVHENHLFILMIPAALLIWIDRRHWFLALAVMLMFNINMFLFYGIDGLLHFPRAFFTLDPALPLSILFLTFFAWLARKTIISS